MHTQRRGSWSAAEAKHSVASYGWGHSTVLATEGAAERPAPCQPGSSPRITPGNPFPHGKHSQGHWPNPLFTFFPSFPAQQQLVLPWLSIIFHFLEHVGLEWAGEEHHQDLCHSLTAADPCHNNAFASQSEHETSDCPKDLGVVINPCLCVIFFSNTEQFNKQHNCLIIAPDYWI